MENRFPAIIGVLLTLAFPLFSVIWGMKPITTGTYVEICVFFTGLFLILLAGAQFAEKRWPEAVRRFGALFVTVDLPALFVWITLFAAGAVSASTYETGLLLFDLLFLAFTLGGGTLRPEPSSYRKVNAWVVKGLPFFLAFVVWIWILRTYPIPGSYWMEAWAVIALAIGLVAVFTWIAHLLRHRPPSIRVSVIAILAGILLIGLVYRPGLYVDRHHYNFYMAPVNDVLHGKVPFVNTTSQYGVGVIYAIALTFRALSIPPNYDGLSFLVDILFILQYLLLAFMLFATTRDLPLTLAGVLAIIYFNYLSVAWPSMLRTPAQSPLRYGLIYLLLGIALLNTLRPSRPGWILEWIFLGVASVWSLETFLYSLISLDAFHFVGDILFAAEWKEGCRAFGRRILFQLGVVAASWGGLLLFCRSAAGQFPDLRMYLDYFQSYASVAYNGGPIGPHLFRTAAVMSIYFLTIFAVLNERFRQRQTLPSAMASMLVGMSAAGLLEYNYYFVYYLDYHLALLCVPIIFVLALWIAFFRKRVSGPAALRVSAELALLFTLLLIAALPVTDFYDKVSNSLLYEAVRAALKGREIAFANPYDAAPSLKSTQALTAYIQKYAGDEPQIVIFVAPEIQTEALFLSGKTDLLDISDSEMSSISPTYANFVLAQARAITPPPPYIFYDRNEGDLDALQQEVFKVVTAETKYVVVDQMNNIVVLKKAN